MGFRLNATTGQMEYVPDDQDLAEPKPFPPGKYPAVDWEHYTGEGNEVPLITEKPSPLTTGQQLDIINKQQEFRKPIEQTPELTQNLTDIANLNQKIGETAKAPVDVPLPVAPEQKQAAVKGMEMQEVSQDAWQKAKDYMNPPQITPLPKAEPTPAPKQYSIWEKLMGENLTPEEKWQRNLKLKQSANDIAYGLAGLSGAKLQKPGVAQENEISPEQKAFIEQALGTSLPPKITWAQLQSVAPEVAGVAKAQISSKAQAANRAFTQGMQTRKENKLSPEGAKRIMDIDNTLSELDRVDKGIDQSGENMGPIGGRLMEFNRKLGISPPEQAALLAQIKYHALDIVRTMVGTRGAGSPILQKQIQDLTPSSILSPAAAKAVVQALRDELMDRRSNTLNVEASQGHGDVQRLLKPGQKMTTNEAGEATGIAKDTTTLTSPDGKQSVDVPNSEASDIKALQDAGWR